MREWEKGWGGGRKEKKRKDKGRLKNQVIGYPVVQVTWESAVKSKCWLEIDKLSKNRTWNDRR